MSAVQFHVAGRSIPLEVIRRAGVRRMNLRIGARSECVKLTLPRFVPLGPALDWVETKRTWVEAQLAAAPAPVPFAPGLIVPFAGRELRLDWEETHPRMPKVMGQTIRIGGPEEAVQGRLLRWLKREAKSLLTQETHEFAARARVIVASIGVGDPVSRWGSCAPDGAIRYSWRLILAPEFVRRATVAHEVAHRVHMNHGRAFHALVAEILEADPAPARRWLKSNGKQLHGFGCGS